MRVLHRQLGAGPVMAIPKQETDITASLGCTNQETVMREPKGQTPEGRTRSPSLPGRGEVAARRHGPPCRQIAVTLVLLPAALACGRKSGQELAQSREPATTHDSVRPAAPVAPPDPSATGARHTHLKGAQTEAICTSLADVQQFYTPGQDPTQESLSCSMIFGGQSTADVAVLGTHGAYVHVRLYDKAGHFSEGYMRGQALR